MQTDRRGSTLRTLVTGLFCLLSTAVVSGQVLRIGLIDESQHAKLVGNVHPLARAEFEKGSAPLDLPMERMLMVLKRSSQQEEELKQLLDDQQNKNSSRYHNWLTPEQFGQQFGPEDSDLEKIVAWLQTHSFHDIQISKGRTIVEFSGTAGQVQDTFGTRIQRFVVNGVGHWANASDPTIPVGLSSVVAGVVSLHNFPRKPLHHVVGVFARTKANGYQLVPSATLRNPLWTRGGSCGLLIATCYALGPYDFATIYNVLPLWNASSPIDGTGQTIAIVGQSDIYPSDVADFRSAFGLPAPHLNVIHNGPDPGNLPSSGDETESDLDVQWAGAIAKGATIDFVVSASTNSSAGVDLSAQYVVDNDLAPVMSESYGECELGLGTAGNLFYSQLWQQASAEGITVLVSAGDSGSAVCDAQSSSPATYGLSVNGFSSTPYNVAIGGTDFNDLQNPTAYWNTSNASTTQASAKGYIPEMTWNDSCTNSEFFHFGKGTTPEGDCNDASNAFWPSFLAPVGGSGGASNCTTPTGASPSSCSGGYSKPIWQTGPGVPNDAKRDVPDVSMFAGDGANANFYLICQTDFYGGCSGGSNFVAIGGTSAPTPAFAGIMAMINQKMQSPQGNANYNLYSLAASSGSSCQSSPAPGGSCIFYDVTAGTNAMPCVTASPNCLTSTNGDQNGVLSGYNATEGYDLATGLGSVNVANLVNNWAKVSFQPTDTTLTLNGGNVVSLTHGAAVSVNVSVKPQNGNGTPTGLTSLVTSKSQSVTNFALTNGVISASTNLLPGGSYTVTAHYAGDGTFAASNSSPGVPVTVSPEPSVTTVQVFTLDQSGNSIPFASGPYGASIVYVRANVAGQSGQGFATGTVNLADTVNGTTSNFSGNPYPLNSEGYALTWQPGTNNKFFAPGAHSLVANYNGDLSFDPSTSPNVSFVVSLAPTVAAASFQGCPPSGCTFLLGSEVTIFGTVSKSNLPSSSQPTGTITFYSNGVQLGAPVAVDSSIIPAIASLATNQLSLGPSNITAQYSGDANYAGSTSPASVLDMVVATNLTLTTPSTVFLPGQSITFTAQVVPAQGGGIIPTGTVQFTANGTAIGSSTLNSSGQAQLVTSTLPGGNVTVAATYSGNQDYLTSANSILMTGSDFALSTIGTVTIPSPGQSGKATILVSSLNGFSGTVTFAITCPGASVEISCAISPVSTSLASTNTSSATLTMATTASSAIIPRSRPTPFRWSKGGNGIVPICFLCFILLFFATRKPRLGWRTAIGILVVTSAVYWAGCGGGGGGSGSPINLGTPPGNYAIIVTVTSGTITHTTTITFVLQ